MKPKPADAGGLRRFLRRQAGRCAALLMACLLAAAPARAETIEAAVRRGDYPAARALLEAQVSGKPGADLHRQHLEGLIALRGGDPARAAAIFRAILARNPGYEPARLQLIVALDQMGQEGQAVRQAEQLAATTDDARLREGLLAEIATRKDARQGGVALRFSLLPSSNVTGGTRAESVTIGGLPFVLDPTSREAGGIGLNLGITAWHGWDLSETWRATVSASADRKVYDTDLRADETELGLRLDFSRKGKTSTLAFGPRFTLLFQNGDEVRRQAGLGGRAIWRLGPRAALTFSGEWLDQSFASAPHRDGHKATGSLAFSWMLSPQTMLTIGLPFEREKARADHLSHRDLGLAVGVQTRFDGGLRLGLDLSVSGNRYDGLYPVFGVARKDEVSSLRLSISNPKVGWRGLMPEFSITRKHQDSNIPLHETWTTDFGLSLVKRF